jgi:hypothetical protein
VPNIMEIWGPKRPGILWATPSPLRDTFNFNFNFNFMGNYSSDHIKILMKIPSLQNKMNIRRKIGYFCRIYDDIITRGFLNFKPKATFKEDFEKRQRDTCIRNRLHCPHCKIKPYKNLQQCKRNEVSGSITGRISRTVVNKKHCDFTQTLIEVGYKSKFKMDKIWYKFDIWELIFPFGNCQLWRLQLRLSR